MPLFLDILIELLPEKTFNQVKEYLDIRKGELKDSDFEKLYQTLVVSFIDTQKGLDRTQAKKFFASDATVDGLLAYLYKFTDPDITIRDKCKQTLFRLGDKYKISGDAHFPTQKLLERFLADLETELRRDVNKSLLPYFADIRGDIAKSAKEISEKIEEAVTTLSEQIAAERKDREQRATQIDDSGEKVTVGGQLIYDSKQKVEPQPPLPVIHCTLEAIDEDNDRYRSVITNEKGKDFHKHNFTLKRDDIFLLNANHWLENNSLQDYRTHFKLDSDRTFTQRLGNHYYELIFGKNGRKDGLHLAGGVHLPGFQLLLELDPEAELLWQVPWEFLHDSEAFLGLSGKVHLVRTPKGVGAVSTQAIPQPLKILIVVSNPANEREFDSERALSSIQEAVDLARRNGWVELEYLEDATYLNFQQRLAAFQPHVVHYIGHGGKNPADKKLIKSPYSGMAGETYLAFENEDGDLDPLYGKHLQQLLANAPSVQLLVLSGCMTGQTAATDALAGVGTALLKEQLPALVVMQYSVLVDTAIQFAKIFYERISMGMRLSQALTEVRQVLAKGREHRADWGIPALYLRSAELQLIDPKAPKRKIEATADRLSIGDLPVVAGFVGRVKELRRLRETVKHPQQPVIYIWGLGGIGKTSLTAKLIEKLEQERAIDGWLVVRCHQIEPTFAALVEKIGNFIKLQGVAGHAEAGIALQDSRYDVETRVSLLNRVIKERRYLFVFDNFESLLSEKVPQVGWLNDPALETFFHALFSHNWHSTFLFTCRYQWDLLTEEPGILRYACGLPLANALVLHLQGLSPAQIHMLMKNLPTLGKLTFTEQTQVLPLVLGHPHTVHIFDAYLGQYGLKSVLQDDEITRRGDSRIAPTEIINQLGEYFLDGLWTKLNEKERDILGILSVFRTSLNEEGLRQLVPDPAALTTLLNYSLVQRMSSHKETSPSYGVHPVVRGYVESKFSAKQMKAYHLGAVDFYVAQQAAQLPKFERIDQWTPKLLAQVADLAAQRGNTPLALSLTEGLLEMQHHLFAVGEYDDAGGLVTSLTPLLHMIGRRQVAKNPLHQSIASLEGFNKYVAIGNLATLLNDEGKWQEALDTYQECINFYKKAGDEGRQNVAVVYSQQAQIYQERGEYEQALELERKAMKIDEELGNEQDLAVDHYRIAQLLYFMKRYDEALKVGETALEKARQISNAQYEGACLHQFGMTLNKLNRPKEAFERFQESLQIKERLGNREGQADTLGEMGTILIYSGQYSAAIEVIQRGLDINIDLQHYVKAAIKFEKIGYIFEQKGHFREALEKYQESLRLTEQYCGQQDVEHVKRHIARVKAKLGR